MTISFATRLTEKLYPRLRADLYKSDMDILPEKFFWLCLGLSAILTGIFIVPIGLILILLKKELVHLIFLSPIFYIGIFLIVLRIPGFNAMSQGRKTEAEIAVTGRRLLIQLESGKSLVNSLLDMSSSRDSSKALQRLSYELYMGKPLDTAIHDAIDSSPSPSFRKLFIQINNSLRTGSDLKHTVKATLEEITRRKVLDFEEFGKKLSPLGLFYMIFGTIAPSLGVVIFVMLLTFLGIPIKFATLSMFLVAVVLVQAFFLVIFSKIRPELEL
jgi:hypothetical protein